MFQFFNSGWCRLLNSRLGQLSFGFKGFDDDYADVSKTTHSVNSTA